MRLDRTLLSKIRYAYRNGTLVHRVNVHVQRFLHQWLGLAAFNRWCCRKVWTRIEPRKIVFSNFRGNGYGCNPKYISEELLRRGGYDIVLANIVADVIISLTPLVRSLLAEHGHFLCSGIISGREQEVADALRRGGFDIRDTYSKNDWFAYHCMKGRDA